jgi:hypothetical protein
MIARLTCEIMQFRPEARADMIPGAAAGRRSSDPRGEEPAMKAKDRDARSEVTWELERDATLRLGTGRDAVAVRVDRGTVLVTREGDPEDHVLEAGEATMLAGKGLAVAWALSRATVRVARAPLPRAA